MKTCPHCNANLADEATFCAVCGAQLLPNQPQAGNVDQTQPTYAPPAYSQPPVAQPQEQPVSVGGWIGRSLIPLIPFVGSLIYLIMLFIWMGDKTKEATFRNWAKAQLIVMAVAVVLGIIVAVVAGAAIASLVSNQMYY